MNPAHDERPSAGEVASALNDAAAQLGSYVSYLLEHQPGTAMIAAATAGFLAGGGLTSPLGTRVAASTVRATLGNLATLVALDVVRRALEDGGQSRVGPESARAD